MIDCRLAKSFLREYSRMCGSYDCNKCPLYKELSDKNLVCCVFILQYPDIAIKLVQEWSNKHPLKTCYDDFCEKFPKISKLDKKNFYCNFCKADFYGEEIPCQYIGEGVGACEKCWTEPIDNQQ